MAGSLRLKNDVQPVTKLPQSQRQVHDVLSAAESMPPISDSGVTCSPMTRPEHLVAVQRHRRTGRTSAAAAAAAAAYPSVCTENFRFLASAPAVPEIPGGPTI